MSHVYQDCTNSVPTVYQSSKNSQNSKNDHWCTNRHMFTKTVPTVYQSSKTVKSSQKQSKDCQKTVKTAKMTIGVPIVTCLPRLYQQCTLYSVPIVKNSIKNSEKTVKTAKMTIGVPIVACLHRVRRIPECLKYKKLSYS